MSPGPGSYCREPRLGAIGSGKSAALLPCSPGNGPHYPLDSQESRR